MKVVTNLKLLTETLFSIGFFLIWILQSCLKNSKLYIANLIYHFSYDYGFVHVIHFNTEVYFFDDCWDDGARERQLKFLEEDLIKANENRKAVPWVVTLGHRWIFSYLVIILRIKNWKLYFQAFVQPSIRLARRPKRTSSK